ncbi:MULTISPECIES: Mu transposase C-terminal domain-containing protein [Pseudomonas fluorescens group]|uniref:Mu transposase C-terminal domain-containing protein n=1 Tax=Pseudomonas fluorescens group TaxID=136843 RepID=UPI00103BAB25|nr:Mu transposase C-terminal domain-containing protein [Pseudomonas parakoreensis]
MNDFVSEQPKRGKIDRSFVNIAPGQVACYQKETFRITQILDFQSVLAINVETGQPKVLQIGELKPFLGDKVRGPYADYDLEDIGAEEWAIAQKRYAVIAPLLSIGGQSRSVVEQRAKDAGVDAVTVYRWLRRYKEQGEVTALIPLKRGWGKGRSRISEGVEKVIAETIDDFYLTEQRPDVASTVYEVRKRCKALKLSPPTVSTVQARIKNIPDRTRLRRRGDKELAGNKYDPRPGGLNTEYPLQIVQIDHTPADMIIVDDVHRRPIGRPWLTLAICVYSRMVTGYYLSMDAPSAVSVAMCVVHSILPKEKWLALHGVDAEWPVWGKMGTLHSDNGADFKTNSLVQSCVNHNIRRDFRPKKNPQWGGHIERWMGTFAGINKKDRGATFSNPAERREYDSEKQSIYTFAEYEQRLVRNLIKYNNKFHEEIDMAPIKKWNLAFFGDKEHDPIVPLPPRVADPWGFQLDFLPATLRTIHPYGVEMDAMYFAEALRPWIGATDPKTGKARKFLFRRDPRDINRIWFYDPALKEHFEVPIIRGRYAGVTVGEYVNAKKKARKAGRDAVNHDVIERMLDENKQQETEAAMRTKQARKSVQKRTNNTKQTTPARPTPHVEPKLPPIGLPESPQLLSVDEVDTFGEVW